MTVIVGNCEYFGQGEVDLTEHFHTRNSMKLWGDGGKGWKQLSENMIEGLALSYCHKLDKMNSKMKLKVFNYGGANNLNGKGLLQMTMSSLSLGGLWHQERF